MEQEFKITEPGMYLNRAGEEVQVSLSGRFSHPWTYATCRGSMITVTVEGYFQNKGRETFLDIVSKL